MIAIVAIEDLPKISTLPHELPPPLGGGFVSSPMMSPVRYEHAIRPECLARHARR